MRRIGEGNKDRVFWVRYCIANVVGDLVFLFNRASVWRFVGIGLLGFLGDRGFR